MAENQTSNPFKAKILIKIVKWDHKVAIFVIFGISEKNNTSPMSSVCWANFEVFGLNISSSVNHLFQKSVHTWGIKMSLFDCFLVGFAKIFSLMDIKFMHWCDKLLLFSPGVWLKLIWFGHWVENWKEILLYTAHA